MQDRANLARPPVPAKVEQVEALSRAVNGLSFGNYPAIFAGFMAKGIPEVEIKPRENVFTYQAWRALGRQVRRGEHWQVGEYLPRFAQHVLGRLHHV